MPQSPGCEAAPANDAKKAVKLGLTSGVFIPVFLNILSILMFLRFGLILGQVGFLGFLGATLPPQRDNIMSCKSCRNHNS